MSSPSSRYWYSLVSSPSLDLGLVAAVLHSDCTLASAWHLPISCSSNHQESPGRHTASILALANSSSWSSCSLGQSTTISTQQSQSSVCNLIGRRRIEN